MPTLDAKIKELEKFNITKTLEKVVMANKSFILDLVRTRLLDKGEDADGKKLKTYNARGGNVYADVTMNLKAGDGQPTDHVTLYDEGEAHKTMKLRSVPDMFLILFDEIKKDGKISDNIDLTRIFDLSDDELKELQEEILNELQNEIRQQIC